MTDVLLNECGDIDYTDGKLTILTGVDAIRQRWLIYIRTFLGEWFLDQAIGVPYIQQILKKGISRQVIKQVFTTATLQVPGVVQVVSVIVDSLDVATRFAEVTVTCVVTGEEGPETGVFKFTGTIPPEGCSVPPPAPASISDQWYWFDTSDLSLVESTPGQPYIPGQTPVFLNKFENQAGEMHGIAAGADPKILPVLNGRKALDLTSGGDPEAVSSESLVPVAALRTTTGHTGVFTVFGVYEPSSITGFPTYDPLVLFDGVDVDGTTRRWINIEFRPATTTALLELRVTQAIVGSDEDSIASTSAATVLAADPWVFCVRYGSGGAVKAWANNTVIIDGTLTIGGLLQQLGSVAFNNVFDASGDPSTPQPVFLGDSIGYSAALADTEVDSVLNYLIAKWGL